MNPVLTIITGAVLIYLGCYGLVLPGLPGAHLLDLVQGIDLTVATVTCSDYVVGEDAVIASVVRNNGFEGTNLTFAVACYMDDLLLDSQTLDGLGSGQFRERHFTWHSTAGNHTVTVIADVDDVVVESDEDNNEKSMFLSQNIPETGNVDLRIDFINVPNHFDTDPNGPKHYINESCTFNVDIINDGSDKAGSFVVSYSIDSKEIGVWPVEGLSSGETVAKSYTFIITKTLHTVKLVVDSLNQITETNENNNVQEFTIESSEESNSGNGSNGNNTLPVLPPEVSYYVDLVLAYVNAYLAIPAIKGLLIAGGVGSILYAVYSLFSHRKKRPERHESSAKQIIQHYY